MWQSMQLSRIFAPNFANSPRFLCGTSGTFPNKRPPRVRARALHGTSCSASANSGSSDSFASAPPDCRERPQRRWHRAAAGECSSPAAAPERKKTPAQATPRFLRGIAHRFPFAAPATTPPGSQFGGHDLGGHDFSRAVIARVATRLQPLRALLPLITRPLPFHMLSPCPMAPLARNPQYVPVFSVDIPRRC
jgi:hypothetical protein